MSYQDIHLILLALLASFLSLIGIFGKSKYSLGNVLWYLFTIGMLLTALGLFMSFHLSRESIYNLAVFKQHYFTAGFNRVYLVGLSMLCAIPIIAIGKIRFTHKPENDSLK